MSFDPRGQTTVMGGSDHYFHTWCLSVRTSVPIFQNPEKQSKRRVKLMIATGPVDH